MRKFLVKHGQTNKVRETCDTPASNPHTTTPDLERNSKIRILQQTGTKLWSHFLSPHLCSWIHWHASDLYCHKPYIEWNFKTKCDNKFFQRLLKTRLKRLRKGPASTIIPYLARKFVSSRIRDSVLSALSSWNPFRQNMPLGQPWIFFLFTVDDSATNKRLIPNEREEGQENETCL